MSKSFKRFCLLFIVVISASGVIFLGDIPQKILPPAQAQSWLDEFLRAGGKLIQIGTNSDGFNVGESMVRARKNVKLVWNCFADGYQVAPSRQNVGHHMIEVFKVRGREMQLVANRKVPYNGYSSPLILGDTGTYVVKIDGQTIHRIISE